MSLEPEHVKTYLRKNGVHVHHAALEFHEPHRIVVYLESNLGLAAAELAQGLVASMAEVLATDWTDHTRTMLLVTPHPDVTGGS